MKPLLRYFSCVLRVIVLLEVNLRPSLRSWALWRVSSRIYLYLAAFIFPSIATSRPVPAAEKHPHSMMLPPPCFTVGTVLDRWWASAWFFLHTYRLELRPKSSILVSSDQRIYLSTILESFRCFLANSMQGFHVSCTEERLSVGPLCHKAPDWWRAAVMLTFYTFSHLTECISGAQPQWSLGSSLPRSPRLFSPDSPVWPDGQL